MLFLDKLLKDKSPANSTKTTRRIQEAIDRASSENLGTVVIPPGTYTITTLFLKSGVTLRLEAGVVLEAETHLELYPEMSLGHNKDRQPYHLIHAEKAVNIGIEGQGIIDGKGMSFWEKPPNDEQYKGIFYKAKDKRISPLINFLDCVNVRLEGITINDSPGWTVHPHNCDHVHIHGITINNHLYGPNTDGLDINGCRYVFISNCRIHGCDDNIIIKATEDARSTEYVTITNCILESTCAAIGIGAETRSGIRHIAVSNCTVLNSIRMIQIIMWDGGIVENVVIQNITGNAMTALGTDRAIHLDIQEHNDENPELGKMRNVLISNVICRTRGRILMTAQAGAWLENISLRDIYLEYPEVEDPAETVPQSRSSQLSNFSPEARVARAAVVGERIKRLSLQNISVTWPARPTVPMHGLWLNEVEKAQIHCPFLSASHSELEMRKDYNPY